MSNTQFNKGDFVQLKSGGFVMKVSNADEENRIGCQWLYKDKVQVGYFPPESLKKVEDEDAVRY